MVLTGVLAPASLLGVFRLVRAWIDLQRTQVTVRVMVEDSQVEVRVDGRTDPQVVVTEVLRIAEQTRHEARAGQDS